MSFICFFIRIRKPVLVQKFADQTITEGDKLELQIKHLGSKPVTVTWYRDDDVIQAVDRCKMLSDDDIHLLRVDPVEIDDEAIYKCVVKNQAGQDQCEAAILVEGSISVCVCGQLPKLPTQTAFCLVTQSRQMGMSSKEDPKTVETFVKKLDEFFVEKEAKFQTTPLLYICLRFPQFEVTFDDCHEK